MIAQKSTPNRKFGWLWFAVVTHSCADVVARRAKQTDGVSEPNSKMNCMMQA
jgi:hypothetical protein